QNCLKPDFPSLRTVKSDRLLAGHPDAGRVVPELNQTPIRELIHPPFRVVYLRQASIVTLIRVWRSERVLEMPEGTIAGP
ncbi:MAG TPA: type II toxin-antitoxin system RelE/ParE family toxin, partial [Anaerolineales bacterium]